MSAQVAQDLRAAADVLKRDGWTQGTYHDGDGCHCVQGAIGVVVTGNNRVNVDEDCNMMEGRFAGANNALLKYLGLMPWDWNDEEGRTADEVIAALEAAADAAEAQQ